MMYSMAFLQWQSITTRRVMFDAGQRSFELNISVPMFMYDSEYGVIGALTGE